MKQIPEFAATIPSRPFRRRDNRRHISSQKRNYHLSEQMLWTRCEYPGPSPPGSGCSQPHLSTNQPLYRKRHGFSNRPYQAGGDDQKFAIAGYPKSVSDGHSGADSDIMHWPLRCVLFTADKSGAGKIVARHQSGSSSHITSCACKFRFRRFEPVLRPSVR